MKADDWKQECAVFDNKLYRLRMFGQNAGRVASSVAMAKVYPKMKVVVPDLNSLDSLVKMGVQPSQIIVTSEFTNTSRFDMLSSSRLDT